MTILDGFESLYNCTSGMNGLIFVVNPVILELCEKEMTENLMFPTKEPMKTYRGIRIKVDPILPYDKIYTERI